MARIQDFEQQLEPMIASGGADGIRALPGRIDIALGTSTGPQRTENQDRAIVARGIQRQGTGRSFLTFIVADGMGGMESGGVCASMAITAFVAALMLEKSAISEASLAAALRYADKRVYDRFRGKGGSTLTAIVIDQERGTFVAHVGDSRAVVFSNKLPKDYNQITVDDTLAAFRRSAGIDDTFSNSENSLLQYVGIGGGLTPQVKWLGTEAKDSSILLMSDGVHYIGETLIQSVCQHASTAEEACKRLLSVSEWMSGHDNATAILVRPPTISRFLEGGSRRQNILTVWSASTLTEFVDIGSFVEHDVELPEATVGKGHAASSDTYTAHSGGGIKNPPRMDEERSKAARPKRGRTTKSGSKEGRKASTKQSQLKLPKISVNDPDGNSS